MRSRNSPTLAGRAIRRVPRACEAHEPADLTVSSISDWVLRARTVSPKLPAAWQSARADSAAGAVTSALLSEQRRFSASKAIHVLDLDGFQSWVLPRFALQWWRELLAHCSDRTRIANGVNSILTVAPTVLSLGHTSTTLSPGIREATAGRLAFDFDRKEQRATKKFVGLCCVSSSLSCSICRSP